MLNSTAAHVIKAHLFADPIGYLRASYATWVITAKAVTKAAAHVLQCVACCSYGECMPLLQALTRDSRYTTVTQIAASTLSKLV